MIQLKFQEMAQKIGKNISEIARETGINRNTIQALALGKVNGLKFETIDKLCQTYKLQVSDILEFQKNVVNVMSDKTMKLYKQEGECIPFTMHPPSLAGVMYTLPSEEEPTLGPLYIYYKENYVQAFWSETSMRRASRAFYSQYVYRPAFDALFNEFVANATRIEGMYQRSFTIDFTQMSQLTLLNSVKELEKACHPFWMTSIFIDSFDVGVDQEIITEISEKFGFSKEEVQYLTTPTELTFSGERQRSLFRIIDEIKSQKWTKDKLMQYVGQSPQIQKFRQDFDYVSSNYATVKHATTEQIVEEMWGHLNKLDGWKKEYQSLLRYEQEMNRRISDIVKKYKLKENPLWVFERLTIWREYRKKINLMSIHVQDAILKRVESLTGISKKYLQYLVPDEVPHVISGLVSSEELIKRRNEGVFFFFNRGQFEMMHGAEAESLLEECNTRLGGNNTTTVIQGQTACRGYAKGIARVILDESQFSKFQEGEILVTGMTRPEFVPLMKKALAIVTNEGGITCHAAIVSRELGKPCIIGTKNATTLIKDGALVEVRANHGTVRVLS